MPVLIYETLTVSYGHFIVKKIRVLFGKNVQCLRRFFGDNIEQQGDMEVVDEIDDPVELLVELRDVNVDVIILSMDHGESSGLSSHLFAEYPEVTLVLLDEDYRFAYIENLCPHRSSISDVSSDGIISALRLVDQRTVDVDQNHAGWQWH